MVVGVALTLEPHNSVCLGFCPGLGRVESPGVRRVRLQEAWRVFYWISREREMPVRFTGKWGDDSSPKATQLCH